MARKAEQASAAMRAQHSNDRPARKRGTRARWTVTDDKQLKRSIQQGLPTDIIAVNLKRTESAIRQRVERKGLALTSANRASSR